MSVASLFSLRTIYSSMKSVVLDFLLLGEWITDLLWICRQRAKKKTNSVFYLLPIIVRGSLSLISIGFIRFVVSICADLSDEDDDDGKNK